MTRWFVPGLAALALMVAPFSDSAAQGGADVPSGQATPWQEEPGGGEPIAPGAATPPATPPEATAPPPPVPSTTPGSESDETFSVPGAAGRVQDDLAPGAVIVGDGEPIGIEEAVAMAIQNGLDVEVERYAPLIAEADAAGAWGAYDPAIVGNALYEIVKSPNAFTLNNTAVNRDRIEGGSIGVQQLIPYLNGFVEARFASDSVATRSTIQAYDPQYNSSFFINARVPLLRDLVWNDSWTNVKIAGVLSQSAEQEFRRALMDTVQRTVNSYWGLVAARDRVRVAQKSLETARALLDQTRTQYEVGVVSQVEVVEAEAGVANREFELIQSANAYRNAQDVLIDAVLGTRLKPMTELQLVPTADLTAHRVGPIDVEDAVAQAFAKRPELEIAQNAIEQSELNLKFAKSQRLPQLDLEGRFGYVGLGGKPNQTLTFGTPPPQRSYSDSMDNFFERDGAENYRVQGIVSVPIPNTRGRKLVDRGEFELQRSQSSRIRLEQEIILEVRQATRTLLAAAQGIEAAERRRLAAEEQLRAERIRLEHGESTPFEVLQREEDLVEAESQKINALQTFHGAETALERARGTILEIHSIEVDAVRKPVS